MTWEPAKRPVGEYLPKKVGESLDTVTERLGLPSPGTLGLLFGRWADVAGRPLADHVRPEAVEQGTLILTTTDPAWAAQIPFLESVLLDRLRDYLPGAEIDRVVVRVGRSGTNRRLRPPRPYRS